MGYSFVVCNQAQESHTKEYITIFPFFFFSVIFATPWFVEIQKVCYHDNVT